MNDESSANKAAVLSAFADTEKGDGRAFVALLADDVRWTIIGTGRWSGLYDGKASVLRDLLGPLGAELAGSNRVRADRVIAEGSLVVVEARNLSRTVSGQDYTNRYCWVMTMAGGQITEIVEYTDTLLIDQVLGDPRRRDGRHGG